MWSVFALDGLVQLAAFCTEGLMLYFCGPLSVACVVCKDLVVFAWRSSSKVVCESSWGTWLPSVLVSGPLLWLVVEDESGAGLVGDLSSLRAQHFQLCTRGDPTRSLQRSLVRKPSILVNPVST